MTREPQPATPRLDGPREPHVGHVEMVMGTAVTFDVRLEYESARSRARATRAIDECVTWLHWVDETFTTYDEGSFVSRLGRGELDVDQCPSDVARVVDACRAFRDQTSGWFDPWAGPAGGFDPSGLVKGWATQGASERLSDAGFDRHCVNAGGDVVARGAPAGKDGWGVGVAHPLVAGTLCAVLNVRDEAVASSGSAERGLHVWRPIDHEPARDLASVTVVHVDLTSADVFATAAFAMGELAPAWLESQVLNAYAVDAGGHEWCTPGFARRRTWPDRDE